jgi:RNA polymerase sigma factor (sigma-70 family)
MSEQPSMRDEISRLLFARNSVLSSREYLVMRKRLEDGWTLVQIAQALGLSSERIRQIEAEAVNKLRGASDA